MKTIWKWTLQPELSFAQLRALRGAAEGNPAAGIHGRSAYGGLAATLWCLRKRGLLDAAHKLTGAGREALRTANARGESLPPQEKTNGH